MVCSIVRLNTSPATWGVVHKSYEFVLQHVGQHKDSGQSSMEPLYSVHQVGRGTYSQNSEKWMDSDLS